jgi:hypothetical protein
LRQEERGCGCPYLFHGTLPAWTHSDSHQRLIY